MKKIFLIVFTIISIIGIIFVYLNLDYLKPRTYGAYEISEIIKNKEDLIGEKIQVIGIPGCTFLGTQSFDYYYLYLNTPNNKFEGIYINFDLEVGKNRGLINDSFNYWDRDSMVMVQKRENCKKILDKISIIKNGNRIVVEGILSDKRFPQEKLSITLE